MKQRLSTLFSTLMGGARGGLLFLALVATTALWAEDFSAGGIYYNILTDKTNEVEVTYRGSNHYDYDNEYSGSVAIPETVTYNGTTYSVTSIGERAFLQCSGLTSVTIPNSVTSIGDKAFYNCHFLISVTIPNSVMSIGNGAFALCAGLSSITIPNSVTSIGSFAFDDCIFSMQNFINNSSLNEKGNNYWGAEIVDQDIDGLLIRNDTVIDCRRYAKSAIIPSSVTTIGEDAFRYCNSLISITIPNSIISIGDDAFSECYSLASVVLPESISRIGKGVFSFCYSLTTFNISNSITNIGERAFMECSGLISLTIPNSITTIGEDAFAGCTFVNGEFKNNSSLSAEENNYWGAEIVDQDIDGMLIRNDTIFNCRPYITSAIIPNNITCIGDLAFGECEFLDSVIIPNSVTSIGEGAFIGCYSLTFIVIPNSITSIEEGTFAACESLTSVTIPNSITNISGYAFQDCLSLKNITIPNSVTNIGELAFSYCYSLTSVSILATTPPALGRNVFEFDGCKNPTLFVPCEALEAYQAHEQWGQFTNIQCIASEETDTEDVIIESGTTTIQKTIRNGQLYIYHNGSAYTVMGQKVSENF